MRMLCLAALLLAGCEVFDGGPPGPFNYKQDDVSTPTSLHITVEDRRQIEALKNDFANRVTAIRDTLDTSTVPQETKRKYILNQIWLLHNRLIELYERSVRPTAEPR